MPSMISSPPSTSAEIARPPGFTISDPEFAAVFEVFNAEPPDLTVSEPPLSSSRPLTNPAMAALPPDCTTMP